MTLPARGSGTLGEAAAPLLLIAAIAAVGVLALDVWIAAGVATCAGTGHWTTPPLDLSLAVTLVVHGPAPLYGPAGRAQRSLLSWLGCWSSRWAPASVLLYSAGVKDPSTAGRTGSCTDTSSATSPVGKPTAKPASSAPPWHRASHWPSGTAGCG
jgi:hypothetical protein